jgi:hypothetical protein
LYSGASSRKRTTKKKNVEPAGSTFSVTDEVSMTVSAD